MSHPSASPAGPDDPPAGDPWHAFGTLIAGVLVYGLLGALADRWLGTSFLVGLGIVLGAGLGAYMSIARLVRGQPPGAEESR